MSQYDYFDEQEEFDEEEMYDVCIACGNSPALLDPVGFSWCPDCQERGDVLTWGKMHGWPELAAGKYTVAPGDFAWKMVATFGEKAMIAALLTRMDEACEEEDVA